MRDDRLNNLKGEMKSLSSMQAMIKYFINAGNKDSFFVNYELRLRKNRGEDTNFSLLCTIFSIKKIKSPTTTNQALIFVNNN